MEIVGSRRDTYGTQVGEVRWLGLSIGLWSEITVGSWIPNEARAKNVQNLDVLEYERWPDKAIDFRDGWMKFVDSRWMRK
jgi:hypothetical protein